MFPQNESRHGMNLRTKNKFKLNKLRTNRYEKSANPYMRELLNKYERSRTRKQLMKEPD